MDAAALVLFLAAAGVDSGRQPLPDVKSGVVLTQFTEPIAPRYGAPPAAVPTNSAVAPAQFDAFTQAPPAATAAVSNANAGGTWNADAAANPLRMPAAAAPGQGAAWNGGGPVAEAAPTGPLDRIGAEFQNATAPLQEGFDQFNNRIRTATNNLSDRTGQLFDELGRPLRSALNRDNGVTAIPPAGAGAGVGQPGGTDWNQPPGASANAAENPATAPTGGATWNPDASVTPPAGVAAGEYAPPFDPGLSAPPLAGGQTPATRGAGVAAPPTGSAVDADRWANAEDPRFRTGSAASPPNDGAATNTWPGVGPELPPQTNPFASNNAPLVTPTGNGAGLPAGAATTPTKPEISGGMLALPADRALEGNSAPAFPITEPFANQTVPASGVANVTPAAGVANGSSQPPATNWGSAARDLPRAVAEQNTQPAAAASNARDRAAVILAWVLLFASVAGNMYLFWSYLDVRTKYRALVRKTARAVGSRFSAA
jgi:hypothetical protein